MLAAVAPAWPTPTGARIASGFVEGVGNKKSVGQKGWTWSWKGPMLPKRRPRRGCNRPGHGNRTGGSAT